MNKILRCFIFSSIILFPFLLHCSTDQLSGIEVTNGNCLGKIYNNDNTPASGALVRLIPSGYDPTAKLSGKVDSTFTSADGSYSFLVEKSDFYNIIAEKGNRYCKKDSVSITSFVKQNIGNDTLAEPAFLTGKVRLKPENDPLKVIILFYGTNLYTMPSDTSGYFDTVCLPEGVYTIKAFTTEDGYGIFDTSIVLSSGEILDITLTIPTSYAPVINSFSVIYDTATFSAALNWKLTDTSQIMSYAIHRSINNQYDTMMLVNKDLTSYKDDCSNFFYDTVSYAISAVGKNYKEGYLTSATPFVVNIKSAIMYKSMLDTLLDRIYVRTLKANGNECYCLLSNNSIAKISPSGNIEKMLSEQAGKLFSHFPAYIELDALNNLYVICYDLIEDAGLVTIYKLDCNLDLLDTLAVHDTTKSSITIGENGFIYFQTYEKYEDQVSHTKIRVYDNNFEFSNELTINSKIALQRCSENRIIALTESWESSNAMNLIEFDGAFNKISSFDIVSSMEKDSDLYHNYSLNYVDVISNDLCMIVTTSKKNLCRMLILSNLHGEYLAQILLPKNVNYKTASSGFLYCTKNEYSEELFSFSLKPFWTN